MVNCGQSENEQNESDLQTSSLTFYSFIFCRVGEQGNWRNIDEKKCDRTFTVCHSVFACEASEGSFSVNPG